MRTSYPERTDFTRGKSGDGLREHCEMKKRRIRAATAGLWVIVCENELLGSTKMPALVVTLVGPDRPGLVGVVSDVVRRHDGNWLESRMSHLAGQFAGIVLVEATSDDCSALVADLEELESRGLKVVVAVDSESQTSEPGQLFRLSVVGNDRAGIVREVTQVLTSHEINVEELTTECEAAPQSGGQIFRAVARIRLPDLLSPELVQDELERIATDLMIDITAVEESGTAE